MPPVGQAAMGQSFLLRKPEASRVLITKEEKDLKDGERIQGEESKTQRQETPRVCNSRLEQAIMG